MLIEPRPSDDLGLVLLLDLALKELITRYPDSSSTRGATSLRLATGTRQPEAVALYESVGYELTPPYGKYVDDRLARCYLKQLG